MAKAHGVASAKKRERRSFSLSTGAQFFRLSEKKKKKGKKCEQGLILFPVFWKKGWKLRGIVSVFFVEFRHPVQTEMFIGKSGPICSGSFVRLNFIALVLVSPHCVSRETKVGATFFENLEQTWQLPFCLCAPKYILHWSYSRSNLLCF